MKHAITLIAALVLLTGCQSTPKRVAFNTLATTAASVDAAMKTAGAMYKAGHLNDAQKDDILLKYADYQAAANEALVFLEFDHNAPTPETVLALALSVVNTINQIRAP